MARVKATTSDIYAKLARGECANFRNGSCEGQTPCTVIIGENCAYFAAYVQPLLDSPEFASKYHREAKIGVALQPKSKVIRKRQPKLALAESLPNPAPAAPVTVTRPTVTATPPPPRREVTPVSSTTRTKPAKTNATQRTVKPTPSNVPEQPELLLELTPSQPSGTKTHRRR
ncbi:MAG TPA: hypothetical protein VGL77_11170 [Armatimonadota bacterium]